MLTGEVLSSGLVHADHSATNKLCTFYWKNDNFIENITWCNGEKSLTFFFCFVLFCNNATECLVSDSINMLNSVLVTIQLANIMWQKSPGILIMWCQRKYTHTNTQKHTHAHKHSRIHTHTHTCTHTHTHTQTHTHKLLLLIRKQSPLKFFWGIAWSPPFLSLVNVEMGRLPYAQTLHPMSLKKSLFLYELDVDHWVLLGDLLSIEILSIYADPVPQRVLMSGMLDLWVESLEVHLASYPLHRKKKMFVLNRMQN